MKIKDTILIILMIPTFVLGYTVSLFRLVLQGFKTGYQLCKKHTKDYIK